LLSDRAGETRTIAASGLLLLVAFSISKVAGYLRDVIIAHRFGTGGDMDLYALAFNIPDVLLFLVVAGAVSSAFVPVISQRLAHGRNEEAAAVVNGVLTAALMLLALAVLSLELLAPFVVRLLPGHRTAEQTQLAITLTRVVLIQPFFLGLGGFAIGALNAYRRFRPLAVAPIAYDLATIVGALVLSQLRFHGHALGTVGLAAGVALGAFLHLAVQAPSLLRIGWRPLSFRHLSDPGVRRVALLTMPYALGPIGAQINIAVAKYLSAGLPTGHVAALYFANNLAQVPNLTFTSALTVVMFPYFAQHAARGEMDELRRRVALAVRLNLVVLIPAAVGLIVLGPQIVALLFQHGAFTATSTDIVYPPLAFFAIGIAAQASIFLLVRVYYSLQEVVVPMLIAVASVALNLVANLLLIAPLGAGGLALGTSLASTLNFCLLVFFVRRRLRGFEGRRMATSMAQVVVACALMAAVIWLSWRLLAGAGPVRLNLRHYAALAVALALGVASFLGALVGMRSEEAFIAIRLFLRRRGALEAAPVVVTPSGDPTLPPVTPA
jgi:putative peptidoglycan lipid II flippase